MAATMPRTARAYCGYTECPWICHSTPRIIAIESRFAQNESQTARNPKTSNHELTVLAAATFILIATISAVDSGRTAINPGRARSLDQKSGLENALPIANASSIGIVNVAIRIRRESG